MNKVSNTQFLELGKMQETQKADVSFLVFLKYLTQNVISPLNGCYQVSSLK